MPLVNAFHSNICEKQGTYHPVTHMDSGCLRLSAGLTTLARRQDVTWQDNISVELDAV